MAHNHYIAAEPVIPLFQVHFFYTVSHFYTFWVRLFLKWV